MRAAALLVALLALTASAQQEPRFKRFTTRTDQGRTTRGLLANGLAFFEFAPSTGAGMPTACSTTAPTGARGETLTFTRTGAATCTRTATGGLATTGIADGDLVSLSANQPRVEYDSAGTLGLLVESSRTNNVVRSQEFDNAAWSTENLGGAAAPTVTANAATAPDGTLTAERITFGATSAANQDSMKYVGGGCANPCAVSLYVKGVSGSGTIDFAAAIGQSFSCSYVSTSWTRCTGVIASAGFWGVGNLAFYNGGTTRGAQDVYVWGAQGETASYVTSYIPTTSAAVTRGVEVPYFSLSSPSASQSIAATRNGPTGGSGARVLALTQTNASAAYGIGVYGNSGTGTALLGNAPATLTAGSLATTTRAWASWDGTTFTVNFDGTSNTSAPGAVISVRNSLSVGVDTAGGSSGWADGIVSRVCLDGSPARCR